MRRLSAEAVARRVARRGGKRPRNAAVSLCRFRSTSSRRACCARSCSHPSSITPASLFILQPYSPSLEAAAEECPSSVGRSILNNRPAPLLHHHLRALPSPRSNNSPLQASSNLKGNYQRRPAMIGLFPFLLLHSFPPHVHFPPSSASRPTFSSPPIQRPQRPW